MKRLSLVTQVLVYAFALGLAGCETVINAKLDTGPAILSVDGVLTDQAGPQTIRLTQTAAYFDNRPAPVAAGAIVTVTDNFSTTYAFTDPDQDGYYVWTPATNDTLGKIGRTYSLRIQYQNDIYTAQSAINRVPHIDSIIFQNENVTPVSKEKGYRSEFYVRDVSGATDYYRVRYFRNGILQNRPADIITAYDASFNNNANTDGLLFIRPLRRAANPEKFYLPDDEVSIEIQSLTFDAYTFLQAFQTQLTNTGLFASPSANVPTNLVNTTTPDKPATGYFMTVAVRSRTARVTPENIRASD